MEHIVLETTMKHSDFPCWQAFAQAAFDANSCGRCEDSLPMLGTREEYEQAEKELVELCGGHDEALLFLGSSADEGYTMYRQDEPMMCYTLLGRYY